MSTDSNEDIFLDENTKLRAQLTSANVKINTLASPYGQQTHTALRYLKK